MVNFGYPYNDIVICKDSTDYLASCQGAPQENDAKFRFAIHPQGIRQFHDNCKIAKCQTVATLAPVYLTSPVPLDS